MVATDVVIPQRNIQFCRSGEGRYLRYRPRTSLLSEQRAYDVAMVNKYRLSLEAIRKYANEFSFWQRQKSTGRPPVHERDLLIAFLVRQLFDATFRETEGLLVMLAEYFELKRRS